MSDFVSGSRYGEGAEALSSPDVSGTDLAVPARLQGEGLLKIYQKRRVVDDIAISVTQGEIVGLLGPNGAGKTTTFYMLVGLIPPDRGRVFLDEEDLTDVPMYRRARKGVGYLAQEPSVFRKLTVEQNVKAILETLQLPKEEEVARLEELLEELSLGHLRRNKAYSLSGGERRRLEITRALVAEAQIHASRRAVRGHRPDCGSRHPGHRSLPQGTGNRRHHFGPQC